MISLDKPKIFWLVNCFLMFSILKGGTYYILAFCSDSIFFYFKILMVLDLQQLFKIKMTVYYLQTKYVCIFVNIDKL